MHQNHADEQPQTQTGQGAQRGPGQPFTRDHPQDVLPGEAQVRQQAELAPACQHLRAEAGCHAEQPDADGDCLQPVGHRKAAVEDAQRDGPDLAGRGEFQQLAGAMPTGRLANGFAHEVFVGPLVQVDGDVVDPLVAGQAPVVVAVDDDAAVLTGIVAPDTRHEEGDRLLRLRDHGAGPIGQPLAGSCTMQVNHGLADVHRHHLCAARSQVRWGDRVADQRQGLTGPSGARGVQGPGQQHHGRQGRVDLQTGGSQWVNPRDPGQGRHLAHQGRRQDVAFTHTGVAGTDVQLGWKNAIEPRGHRVTEAGDHDRQGDRQGQTGDHAAGGHRGGFPLATRTLQGQHRNRTAGEHRRQSVEQDTDAQWQRGNPTDQQQTDRHIGPQRDAGHGRQQRQQHRAGDHGQGRQVPARSGHRRRSEALEGQCRRHALAAPRRPPATRDRCNHAQAAEQQGIPGVPLQSWADAVKVAAAQIAPQQPEGQRRQACAQGHAQGTAEQAEQGRFGQHQAQAVLPGQPEHTQQGQLLLTPCHRQGHDRKNEKGPREQRHQRQHAQVDPVGAREVAGAFVAIVGALCQPVGRQLEIGGHGINAGTCP